MMKYLERKIIIYFLIVFFLSHNFGETSYKFEFITVGDIVKRIKNRFSKIDSYQANFKIVSQKHGSKTYQSGRVLYKSSNKILVEFYKPYGHKIVSNGKTMWIYLPSMNVVAEQDLKSSSKSLFFSSTSSGLRRLFLKYHYRFASKEQPEEQTDGTKKYTLLLKQRESRSGFRTIKLWVNEDYFITKAHGETSTGKILQIEFNNIRTDINLQNGIFRFDVPSKARIIKNPIVSEE